MTKTTNDALWERWRGQGDLEAREELLSRYLGLVHHAAREVAPRVRDAVALDELVSAGSLGLLQAMAGFEPERGLAFSTFAMRRIRGAILDELRARDPLTRTERVHARRLEAAVVACEQRLGRAPTVGDLADQLGVDERTIHNWRQRSTAPDSRSFEDEAGEHPLSEQISGDGPDIHDMLESSERGGMIAAALDALPPRERLILSRSFLEERPLYQIAQELGVTESRVCQLRAQAIHRLRSSQAMHLAIA